MKARLLQNLDMMQLLLCTGQIKDISIQEAHEFLLNFSDPSYYEGEGTWDYENLTMESYRGKTIAFVDDNGLLCIADPTIFRQIIEKKEIKYLSAAEYAALHGKQSGIIRRFCLQGRLPGAILKGKGWLIPESCPYPSDDRLR